MKLTIELSIHFKTCTMHTLGYYSDQRDNLERHFRDDVEKKRVIPDIIFVWDKYHNEGKVREQEQLVSYQLGGEFVKPKMIDDLFAKTLNTEELNEINADFSNFDIEYQGIQIDDIGIDGLEFMNILMGTVYSGTERHTKSERDVDQMDLELDLKALQGKPALAYHFWPFN